MILGCDAAGIDEDGNEVVVHAVISSDSWRGDETLDPRRSLLSERHQGAFAERVAVPKPQRRAQAARAVVRGGRLPADGVADRLPDAVHPRRDRARDDRARPGRGRRRRHRADRARHRRGRPRVGHLRAEDKRAQALALGADQAFESGARLPERVDAVMETVGAGDVVTFGPLAAPGGKIVISGATTGDAPPAELTRVFFLQLSVIGSTMGTRDELERLIRFCVRARRPPRIQRARCRWPTRARDSRRCSTARSSARSCSRRSGRGRPGARPRAARRAGGMRGRRATVLRRAARAGRGREARAAALARRRVVSGRLPTASHRRRRALRAGGESSPGAARRARRSGRTSPATVRGGSARSSGTTPSPASVASTHRIRGATGSSFWPRPAELTAPRARAPRPWSGNSRRRARRSPPPPPPTHRTRART